MKRLYQCIESHNVNQSQAREAIYRIFLDNKDTCLSIADIQAELPKIYPQNASLNTIYRHLDLFVSCKLVVTIQDDFKRAYFALTGDTPLVFNICRKCHRVEKTVFHTEKCDASLEVTDYLTMHTKCERCR